MRIYFLLVLSLFVRSGIGQNIRIVNGTEWQSGRSEGVFVNLLDLDQHSFYVKRSSTVGSGFTQVIQKIDRNSLKVDYTMEYKYDESNRDLVDETEVQTSLVNDRIFVFTRKFNIKESVVYLLFRKFDAATGTEIGTQENALAIECPKHLAPHIKFYVEFSGDKSKMLIGSNTDNKMSIYDTKSVSKLGSLTLNFDKSASYSNFTVDNAGNLLCLAKSGEKLDLIKLEQNTTQPIVYALSDKIGPTKTLQLEMTKTGITICGLTNQMKVFLIQFDTQTSKVASTSFADMPAAIRQQLNYEFNGVKGAENKYYSFESIVYGTDGMYLILSESFTTVYYGTGTTSYGTSQRELLVSRFSKAGEFQWMKLIPKDNSGESLGLNTICKNDELYLFYLDHPKSDLTESIDKVDCATTKATSGIRGCAFVCAKLDARGNASRKALFFNQGWSLKPLGKNILNEKENSLTIKMVKGKQERYDKLFVD